MRFEVVQIYPLLSVDEFEVVEYSLVGDQVKTGEGTPLAVQLNMTVNPMSLSIPTSALGSVIMAGASVKKKEYHVLFISTY